MDHARRRETVSYNHTANVSDFEWELIQKIREFGRFRKYGKITLGFNAGNVVDLDVSEKPFSPEKLRKLQGVEV